MDLREVTQLANGPVLPFWQLLVNRLRCNACQQDMNLISRNIDHVDGYQWRCTGCRRKKSLRTGSFFNEFPRTSLGNLLTAIYLWSMRELRTTTARMLSLNRNCIGTIYTLLRYFCGRDLQDRPIIPFGGRNYVVKCDESKFKHKSKYQRGRRARNGRWVFGVLCTEYTPCRGYFQVVARRDRQTLGAILQRVLLPNSEVHTDDWGAYRNLHQRIPGVVVHRVAVHANNFVDPNTGIHTQEIESAWNRLKYYVKRERGVRAEDLQDFLNEQMWRDWRGLGNDFENVLGLLSTYYPL